MLKKISLIAVTAASLSVLAYVSMTISTILQSEPGTVLAINTSEQSPLTARMVAHWRVRAWDGCPAVNGDAGPLGQTLRGYGLEGFDKERVLNAASQLITLGCDVNALSRSGQAPMHEAILYNEAEVVRYLLAHGANPAVTISVPTTMQSATLRHYDGMDATQFARELDARAGSTASRDEILTLLQRHAS